MCRSVGVSGARSVFVCGGDRVWLLETRWASLRRLSVDVALTSPGQSRQEARRTGFVGREAKHVSGCALTARTRSSACHVRRREAVEAGVGLGGGEARKGNDAPAMLHAQEGFGQRGGLDVRVPEVHLFLGAPAAQPQPRGRTHEGRRRVQGWGTHKSSCAGNRDRRGVAVKPWAYCRHQPRKRVGVCVCALLRQIPSCCRCDT